MSACRACGAAIVWAETPDGNKQPFDREPNSAGNRVLLGRGPNTPPLAVPETFFDPEAKELDAEAFAKCVYMPHHATCPKAEEFRK